MEQRQSHRPVAVTISPNYSLAQLQEQSKASHRKGNRDQSAEQSGCDDSPHSQPSRVGRTTIVHLQLRAGETAELDHLDAGVDQKEDVEQAEEEEADSKSRR